jgi:hypothetical protein
MQLFMIFEEQKLKWAIKIEFLFWIDLFVRFWPGSIGDLFRRLCYKCHFMNKQNVSITTGSEFIASENMRFHEEVTIGKNSFFVADGGTI